MQFISVIEQIALKIHLLIQEESKKVLTDTVHKNINSTNDIQKDIDILSQKIIVDIVKDSKFNIAAVISEEDAVPIIIDKESDYIMTLDPLDGSANFDLNGEVGVIFSFFKKKSDDLTFSSHQSLPQLSDLIFSGYVLYGSYISVLVAYNKNLEYFVYDLQKHKLKLIKRNIRIPTIPKFYSLNHSLGYESSMSNLIDIIHKNNLNLRYTGCLVSDFHKILFKGGIFVYPKTKSRPSGKLRLLYEIYPLSHIISIAGGVSTNGLLPISNIVPKSIHQTSPFYIGCKILLAQKIHN